MYLQDNKETLYQWEINQKLIVENELVKEVHFSNATSARALVVEVVEGVAEIPNILLQAAFDIKAFGYCGESVRECYTINVISRTKPDDYIYTETEIKRYEDLEERIAALEEGGGASVDLTDYVKNTDYATPEVGGVVKVRNDTYGLQIGAENGIIFIKKATEKDIDGKAHEYKPIVPSNLEYAVKSVGDGYYVKNTDYATGTKGGVVKVSGTYGTGVNADGVVIIAKATDVDINSRSNHHKPIVPSNLEYAVKSVGDGYYATEAEVGKIDTALTSIIAIQNELIGGEA